MSLIKSWACSYIHQQGFPIYSVPLVRPVTFVYSAIKCEYYVNARSMMKLFTSLVSDNFVLSKFSHRP